MKNKEAKDLIGRFKNHQTTPAEEEKLKYWLHNLNAEKGANLTEEELEQADAEIWNSLQITGRRRFIISRKWVAAAAVVLMVLTGGGLYYFANQNSQQTTGSQIAAAKIVPGGNKAILTLANGKKIVLNSAADGELVKQTGMTIKKTATGKIVYTVTNTGENTPVTYNTIETPIGGQYQVVLADGTLVWLNAATKFRFPTKFTGTERKVELAGEGYFEVAHNKAMPFKVASRTQEVTVLGTHFDVSDYVDEPTVKTVLLQGSVRLTTLSGQNNSTMLKPGQQAMLAADGFTVAKADTSLAVAWKNGQFRFDDEELGSIMRKVSRWYNVTVVYDNDKLKTETFNGVIQRFSNITDLIKTLDAVGKVSFKIEGTRIRVMNRKK